MRFSQIRFALFFILMHSTNGYSQKKSDSIDLELLEIDIEDVTSNYYQDLNLPITIGAFPVKEYSGSGGVIDLKIVINKKVLVGASFSIGDSKQARKFYNFEKSHNIFCNIVVITDMFDPNDYSHVSNMISSRNHPNYLGLGSVKTSKQDIDYIAFIDIEGDQINSYTIINGKLFDLSQGNTILVLPKKDSSLRFVQTTMNNYDFENVEQDLSQLLALPIYQQKILDDNVIGLK